MAPPRTASRAQLRLGRPADQGRNGVRVLTGTIIGWDNPPGAAKAAWLPGREGGGRRHVPPTALALWPPLMSIERRAGGWSRLREVADALVSLDSLLTGAFWIMAASVFPGEPAAAIWLMAPAFAASTIVLHRVVVADATGFLGWAAAVFAGVGLTLVLISLLGQKAGLATDAVGFWGLGLIGPSHVMFGLSVTRLGYPVALGGVGLIVGWCLPLATLVVQVGAIVWTPLGAAWILFALMNVRGRVSHRPVRYPRHRIRTRLL